MIHFLTESEQLTSATSDNKIDFAIALFLILTVVTYTWTSTIKHVRELKATKLERKQRATQQAATINEFVKIGLSS